MKEERIHRKKAMERVIRDRNIKLKRDNGMIKVWILVEGVEFR